MKIVDFNCPRCTAPLDRDENSNKCSCSYCGYVAFIEDENQNSQTIYEQFTSADNEPNEKKPKFQVNTNYVLSSSRVVGYTIIVLLIMVIVMKLSIHPIIGVGSVIVLAILNYILQGQIEKNWVNIAIIVCVVAEIFFA